MSEKNGTERVKTALTHISTGVDRLHDRVTTLEQRARQWQTSANVPGSEDAGFSFLRAFRGVSKRLDLDDKAAWERIGAAREREVFELATRNQQMGVDVTGGYLVPPEISTDLIERLRSKTVLGPAGVRFLTGVTRSPYVVNKHTGGATAQWVGENEAPTSTTHTVGQLEARPHWVGDVAKISNVLIQAADQSMEALVREDMSRTIALAIEKAVLEGTGTGRQPRGIAGATATGNYPGVSVTDHSGAVMTIPAIHAMVATLEDADVDMTGSLAFVSPPKPRRDVKQAIIANYSGQTSAQNPDWVFAPGGFVTDEQLREQIGAPWLVTNNLARNLGTGTDGGRVFFGNWSEVLVPMWGGLELRASDVAGDSSGSAFLQNQTWIVVRQACDVMLRHAESIAVLYDVDA